MITYPCNIIVLSIKDFVPKSMKLVNIIVIFEWEEIGSTITIWPLSVKPIFVVEWLNNVSNIVDQQTESI